MAVRADVDKKFIRRFLLISIGCFLFMLWGIYDGVYTSPQDLERAIAYKDLSKQLEKGEITETQKTEAWKKLTSEKGWPLATPKKPEDAQNYVYFQWFVAVLGFTMGTFFLIKYLGLSKAWVESDDSGVKTSWGRELKFKQITKIEKHKWAKKGIAKVYYDDDSKKSQMMVFDDFKFNREAMGKIMQQAEEPLNDDQIIGDVRESAKTKPLKEDSSGEDE